MLKLINITKHYGSSESDTVKALKGVDIEFRRNEFVSILGPSGCGKTTLLNIIGGLDRYTSGDLVIDGRSTKEYNDHDWDTYRNHSIGFVFQSYNLIPHQTVLSNVELALTLSGVSKNERRKRAKKALEAVGLGDQLNKKPNQMSGGQMQRVAIARALINDPEILLADEPTGALDTETSEQIMELLKDVAKDRLVIMVTHNPDLAERYSTRIINLLDGLVIGDTDAYDSSAENPSDESEATQETFKKKRKKKGTSMSFFTALSLSFNNLLTKKGRTFMTSFAGSIGIIGIALILSLSSGFQAYIDKVQEDTLSSYPISIQSEQIDMSALLGSMMEKESDRANREDGKVYANTDMYDMLDAYMNPETTTNNLEKFKVWLDDPKNGVIQHTLAIQYGYATNLETYAYDYVKNGILPTNDYMALFEGLLGGSTEQMMNSMMSSNSNAITVFQELLQSKDGKSLNDLMFEQYELVDDNMKWPQNRNEIVLIVDKNNEISETFLFALALLDRSTIEKMMLEMADKESNNNVSLQNANASWTFDELMKLKFRLLLPTDKYDGLDTNGDGKDDLWVDRSNDQKYMELVLGSAEELSVVGIIRPKEDALATALNGAVGYTADLTNWYLSKIAQSDLVKYQLAHPETDVLTGLPFKTIDYVEPTVTEKAEDFRNWAATLTDAEKAEKYVEIMCIPSAQQLATGVIEQLKNYPDRASKEGLLISVYLEQSDSDEATIRSLITSMDDAALDAQTEAVLTAIYTQGYAQSVMAEMMKLSQAQRVAMFNTYLGSEDSVLASMADIFVPEKFSQTTLTANLSAFGYADMNKPSSVNIYCPTFEDKDKVASLIKKYNNNVAEEDQITYTDYVALMMSSVSTIIDVISYVLIAFVSISLIVSSIMIGIITYISVLERTKEIGILRAIGASKRDVSRVFNAETLIVGFMAGLIGVLVTVAINIPINIIINMFADIGTVAALPIKGAIILVAISMILTAISGLIPAKVAAKKDPVEALRSE